MGKENPQAVLDKSPKGIFFERFKRTIVAFEPNEWRRVGSMSAEEVYLERKGRSESRVRDKLTDQEFIEEWLLNPNLGKQAAYELGVALGVMMADEKKEKSVLSPQNHSEKSNIRELVLQD